ncbi:hypothetical protein NHX12_018370 [Muraenolepis orangiensis]|uniref:B-block binding subunit of TFIIIC domain-containing protein n=1 Tax=Muraenolepis orangiensis TaxID=630683 RepID=A0A9Q0IXY6_9TELE|nr:hypothetical protein NHX12_018370 [Muraenolepis orangiensis]
MDALDIVHDEVALEGLDGITIPSLWIRLRNRNPSFPLKLDTLTQEFIWRSLVNNVDLDFYELPKERVDVVLFDRFADINPDTGIQTTNSFVDAKQDVYPVTVVADNTDGVQGSCGFYTQRKNVTETVRTGELKQLISLEEAVNRYGQKLVLVASQKRRFRALIGDDSDPDLKVNNLSYCILERLGRARWQGELQRDLHSSSFKMDAGKFHYLRRCLDRYGLITMQSHVIRLPTGQQQHSILLLLKRFHVIRRSKYDILMETLSNALQEAPGQIASLITLRDLLRVQERTFKHVYTYMLSYKLIELVTLPLEDLNPSAGPCNTKRGISQTTLRVRMNIGKLEARMLCRRLERDGMIKGFMVDAGRQRTTKFIGHMSVEASDHMKQFVKEQERSKLLCSSEPMDQEEISGTPPATPKAFPTPRPRTTKGTPKAAKDAQSDDPDYEMKTTKCSTVKTAEVPSRKQTQALAFLIKLESPDTTPADPQALETSCAAECSEEEVEGGPDEGGPGEGGPDEGGPDEGGPDEGGPDEGGPDEGGPDEGEASDEVPDEGEASDDAQKSIRVVEDLPTRKKCGSQLERRRETYRLLRRKNMIVEVVRSVKIVEGVYALQKMVNEEEKQDGVSTKCCKKSILRLIRLLSKEGLVKMYRTTVIQDGVSKKVEFVVHPSVQPSDDMVKRAIEQVRFRISSSHAVARVQEQSKQGTESSNADTSEAKKMNDENGVSQEAQDPFIPTSVRGLSRTLGFQPKMHRLRLVHTFLWHMVENGTEAATSATAVAPVPRKSGEMALSGIYVDEVSWKRFLPPLRKHKEFDHGWALVSDVVLCLPLSLFVQVTQINYKIEGLEDYLNDPVKQHYLVRVLPTQMKRQLLYKRKYIFSFYENMQKLVYMGLLQFGPVEKFQDKDQVFLFVRQRTTIVDTTCTEPHYWQVKECPDKPFERRQYHFTSAEDVENYWFDLLCVCLNTPLGTMSHVNGGTREEIDDGSIPGDGKGAGGLDSEFFAHLKRNWLWTNYLLACKKNMSDGELINGKMRLKSLLSKNALRLALKAGESTAPRCVTTKRALLMENIEMGLEPASRNQQVIGGKRQKRKRTRKEVPKVPRKKRKEPKPRTPAHDEADHRALKMMTRKRVYWSLQEDSMLMLCSVAAKLLNGKLLRPFVPHCVVRDMLHAALENSMDKTSLAVGRRTKVCLAEVYQDEALMADLERNKPSDPNKPEDCAAAFSEYTRLLRHKFSSSAIACEVNLPDTKSQLFSRNKVFTIDNEQQRSFKDTLSCTEDIHAIVLHNLVQSTLVMSNSQMKSSRSFQTFHMYSLFNQEVLCQVFIQCRKRCLVNRRRVNKDCGPKKNRALPILPMSYQLSQTYYKCFTWRFPTNLCTDIFRFMGALRHCGAGDSRKNTDFYSEKGSSDPPPASAVRSKKEASPADDEAKHHGDGEAGADDRGGTAKEPANEAWIQTDGGHIVSGAEHGESAARQGESDQNKEGEASVEMEDNHGEKGDPGRDVNPQNHQPTTALDSFVINGGGQDLSSSPSKLPSSKEEQPGPGPSTEGPQGPSSAGPQGPSSAGPQGPSSAGPQGPSTAGPQGLSTEGPQGPSTEGPQGLSDMMCLPFDSPGGWCAAALTLMSLGLLSVHVSIPKQVVVVSNTAGTKTQAVKSLHILLSYCYPGIVQPRHLSTCDNIVVESCTLRFKLRNTPAHQIFIGHDSPPLDFSSCGPFLVPGVLSHSLRLPTTEQRWSAPLTDLWGFSRPDVEACQELRASLDQAGESGLEEEQLHQTHAHLAEPREGRTRGLQQYLQALQEECQVIRVGALGPRWVLAQHAKPWLLTVSLKPRVQQGWQTKHRIPFLRKRNREVASVEKDGTEKDGTEKVETEKVETVETETVETEKEKEEVAEPPIKRQRGATEEEEKEKVKEEVVEVAEPPTKRQRGAMEEGLNSIAEEALEQEAGGTRRSTGEEGDVRENGLGQEEEKCKRLEVDSSPSPSTSPADGGDEEVSFISRPWRMVDGSINRLACKGMLEGVLYHVMSRPGLTQHRLVDHYKDTLQPMAVLDLIQALIDMGCVRKKTVETRKASLFSRPAGSHAETPAGPGPRGPGPSQMVFYEPTISCCLRLAQVLPNEPHWNQFV